MAPIMLFSRVSSETKTGQSTLRCCAQIARIVVLRLGPSTRTRALRSSTQGMFHHCPLRLLDHAQQSFSASSQHVGNNSEDNVCDQEPISKVASSALGLAAQLLAQRSQQALHRHVERGWALLPSLSDGLVESNALCTHFLERCNLIVSELLAQHRCGQRWV